MIVNLKLKIYNLKSDLRVMELFFIIQWTIVERFVEMKNIGKRENYLIAILN